MGSVIQAYAESVFRNAGDALARRALGDALAHSMLAPQVLAPWTPPMEPPSDNRFRAAAHIQRRARGLRGAWPHPHDHEQFPLSRALAWQEPVPAVLSCLS